MFDSFHMDGSWLRDPPGNRLVQSLLHVGRELVTGSTGFQRLTPFQLGTVSSRQECCWGPPCTHKGGDHATPKPTNTTCSRVLGTTTQRSAGTPRPEHSCPALPSKPLKAETSIRQFVLAQRAS